MKNVDLTSIDSIQLYLKKMYTNKNKLIIFSHFSNLI